MTLFHQTRRVLMTVGLAIFLSAVIMFSFAPGNSWAIALVTPSIINQPPALVATMNQVKTRAKNLEGQAQERIGNMTSDLKNQAAGKAKQFEANTQEAILESIDNPNYKPDGQGLRKRDREAVKCLENDVSDCFEQTQGPD